MKNMTDGRDKIIGQLVDCLFWWEGADKSESDKRQRLLEKMIQEFRCWPHQPLKDLAGAVESAAWPGTSSRKWTRFVTTEEIERCIQQKENPETYFLIDLSFPEKNCQGKDYEVELCQALLERLTYVLFFKEKSALTKPIKMSLLLFGMGPELLLFFCWGLYEQLNLMRGGNVAKGNPGMLKFFSCPQGDIKFSESIVF